MPNDFIEHIDDPRFEKVLAACKKPRVRVNVTVRNGVSVSCRAEVSGNTRSIDFDLIGLNSNLSDDAQRRYRAKHSAYLKQHLKQMRPKRPGLASHFGGASIRFQVLEPHASEWFDDVYAALQDTTNFTPIPDPFEMFRKQQTEGGEKKTGAAKQPPPESPEITALRSELKTLQKPTRPKTPETLKEIQRVLKTFERPSAITKYVKQTRGCTCQLCGFVGFKKRNGKLYAEVHHLFHLSKKPPADCLGPEYLIVLCATCHSRMHYADVGEPTREEKGWRVSIEGEEVLFEVPEA